MAQDDEGGASEIEDANADPSGVDADASGDKAEQRSFFDIVGDVDATPDRKMSPKGKRRIWLMKQYVWLYPLAMALWFGTPRLFDRHHKYRRQPKPSLFMIICFPTVYTKVGLVLSAGLWVGCVVAWLSGKLS